jgi:hypothetical protein
LRDEKKQGGEQRITFPVFNVDRVIDAFFSVQFKYISAAMECMDIRKKMGLIFAK